MLSISKITSSKSAGNYYEKDDYYAKDDPNHQKQSKWIGKGAERLGLKGEVLKEDFQKILSGKLPNGQMLGRNQDGKIVHDAGRDLTFSAPKSVSIMALVYNDERLIDAHNQAVAKTIEIIERDFFKTRTIEDGQVIIESAGNLIAATFRHFTSRELDPQLHTHTVIANATESETNFWKCAFFDEIYNNKKLIGAIYRSELAINAKQLGYEIQVKGKDSLFELKNISKELIDHFSTRSKQIREKAGEDASQKKLEQITLKTRVRKKEGENLKDIWQEKLKDLNHHQVMQSIPKALSTQLQTEPKLAKEAIDYAINHLSERKTIFSGNEIAEIALNDKFSFISIDDVNKHIIYLIDKQDHLLVTKRRDLVNFYTTKSALENELHILSVMKEGQNKFQPITTNSAINSKYKNLTQDLNGGQKQALNLILTSKNQFIGIQGYAGVGKTFMLKSANKISLKEGYELVGLSPTGVATKHLENEAGIKSQTLQRFLHQYNGVAEGRGTIGGKKLMSAEFKNKIVVVDESSMISTVQMKNLLTIARELNFKIVFIGDTKQLDSVEAGIPFHEMQRNGLETAKMTEILRQKNQNLKQAVYDTINRNITETFKKIDFNVKEVREEKVVNTAIEEFLKLTPEQRNQTLILTPANETRERVNQIISQKLMQEKDSHNKEAQPQIIYINNNLTETQKTKSYNYQAGDVILFNKNKSALNVQKNQYFQVINVDEHGNLITIKNHKNQEITFNPQSVRGKSKQLHFDVFKTQEKVFGVGDKIAFNKSINKLRIHNSDQALITDINKSNITIKLETGRKIVFDKSSNEIKHIDHSYAITAHKAQGLTCDNVIAVVESYRKHLTTQKNFYVSISRARQSAIIITDHKENTIQLLQKNTGIDISAREHQSIPLKKFQIQQENSNSERHIQNKQTINQQNAEVINHSKKGFGRNI
jgi:conjugative relaxase-like TrwC/TraI family protein